jgi:hypothetical protein
MIARFMPPVEVLDLVGMGKACIVVRPPQPDLLHYHLQMGVQGAPLSAEDTQEVTVDLVVVVLLVLEGVRVEEDTPEEEGSQVLGTAPTKS